MVKSLDDLMERVKSGQRSIIAVAAAEDSYILEMARESSRLGLADFILIGDKNKIMRLAKETGESQAFEVLDEPDHAEAAGKAVGLVRAGEAAALMKGMLHTGTFFKAVLDKEAGLSRGRLITQVSVYDKVDGEGLQLLTDCAMVIQPTLEQKVQIIENAVDLARRLGYPRPRVAVLAALETVNPDMQETLDAAILSKMAERGQIKDAVVDGPFALDNAVSREAARHKGIGGEVAGDADILLAPNLVVANVLTKSLTYFAKKPVAAAIMGASVPIISTSRAAPIGDKVLSIALARHLAQHGPGS